MARPKKTNAEHFKHTRDFRNELPIKAIRQRFGIEGYAITVMLLEFLTGSEYMRLEWSEMQAELLAGDFGTSSETLKAIVEYGCKLNVFRMENPQGAEFSEDKKGVLFSPFLEVLLRDLLEYRAGERGRKDNNRTENAAKDGFFHTENTPSKSISDIDKSISRQNPPNPPEEIPTERSEEKSAVPPPPAPVVSPQALEIVEFCRKLPTLGKMKNPLRAEQAEELLVQYLPQTIRDVAEKFDAHESAAKWQSPFPQLKVWLKNESLQARTAPRVTTSSPAARNTTITQAPAGWRANPVTT